MKMELNQINTRQTFDTDMAAINNTEILQEN